MWLKNTSGQKSASFTFVVVGFVVVTVWMLLSIFSKIGHIEIREFDGATAMTYLSPLLALYFGRRWNETKTVDSDANSATVATADGSAPTKVTPPSDVATPVD